MECLKGNNYLQESEFTAYKINPSRVLNRMAAKKQIQLAWTQIIRFDIRQKLNWYNYVIDETIFFLNETVGLDCK